MSDTPLNNNFIVLLKIAKKCHWLSYHTLNALMKVMKYFGGNLNIMLLFGVLIQF